MEGNVRSLKVKIYNIIIGNIRFYIKVNVQNKLISNEDYVNKQYLAFKNRLEALI